MDQMEVVGPEQVNGAARSSTPNCSVDTCPTQAHIQASHQHSTQSLGLAAAHLSSLAQPISLDSVHPDQTTLCCPQKAQKASALLDPREQSFSCIKQTNFSPSPANLLQRPQTQAWHVAVELQSCRTDCAFLYVNISQLFHVSFSVPTALGHIYLYPLGSFRKGWSLFLFILLVQRSTQCVFRKRLLNQQIPKLIGPETL